MERPLLAYGGTPWSIPRKGLESRPALACSKPGALQTLRTRARSDAFLLGSYARVTNTRGHESKTKERYHRANIANIDGQHPRCRRTQMRIGRSIQNRVFTTYEG